MSTLIDRVWRKPSHAADATCRGLSQVRDPSRPGLHVRRFGDDLLEREFVKDLLPDPEALLALDDRSIRL